MEELASPPPAPSPASPSPPPAPTHSSCPTDVKVDFTMGGKRIQKDSCCDCKCDEYPGDWSCNGCCGHCGKLCHTGSPSFPPPPPPPQIMSCSKCYDLYLQGKAEDWCEPEKTSDKLGYCETKGEYTTCSHLKGDWQDCKTKWAVSGNPLPPPPPPPPPPNSVSARLTLDIDIADIGGLSPAAHPADSESRKLFKSAFIRDVAFNLEIDTARVKILTIKPGSVVVDFMVLADASGRALLVSALTEVFSKPGVSIGGGKTTAAVTVTVTRTPCPASGIHEPCIRDDDGDTRLFWALFYCTEFAVFLGGFCVAAKCCASKQQGWSTPVDDCCSDMGVCCMTTWCPCVTFGNIGAYVYPWDSNSSCLMCFAYVGASFMGFQSCFAMAARTSFRDKLGITGDCCQDCCIHIFAHPCALCQEQRELNIVKSQATMIANVNPVMPTQPMPPQQTMTVQCPAHGFAGMTMQVSSPTGQTIQVAVPAGVDPGQLFTVALPPPPPIAQATVVPVTLGQVNLYDPRGAVTLGQAILAQGLTNDPQQHVMHDGVVAHATVTAVAVTPTTIPVATVVSASKPQVQQGP